MNKDIREYANFQRSIARMLLWGLGVFPLCVAIFLGFVLIAPYASVVAIATSFLLFRHANKVGQRGETNDWGY